MTIPPRVALPSSSTYLDALVVEERADLGQRCVCTTIAVPAGAAIASFADSQRTTAASYLTIQLNRDVHLLLTPHVLECINHSCEPNVSFDLVQFKLVALRPLNVGDELTYAYPSTEWTMTRPFICACGSAQCLGVIDGASIYTASQLSRFALAPFVAAMLRARDT